MSADVFITVQDTIGPSVSVQDSLGPSVAVQDTAGPSVSVQDSLGPSVAVQDTAGPSVALSPDVTINGLIAGTVTRLDPGSAPTITISGTAPNQTLSLGLPYPSSSQVTQTAVAFAIAL